MVSIISLLLSVRSGFLILEPSYDRTVSSLQKFKGRWWIGSVGKSRIYAYQMCHYFFHDTYAANRISNHSLFPLDESTLAKSNYSGPLEGQGRKEIANIKEEPKRSTIAVVSYIEVHLKSGIVVTHHH